MSRKRGAGRPDRQILGKTMKAELRHRFVDTAHGRLVYVFRGDLLVHCSHPQKAGTRRRSAVCAAFPESREERNLRPDVARGLVTFYAGKSAAFDVELATDGLSPLFFCAFTTSFAASDSASF